MVPPSSSNVPWHCSLPCSIRVQIASSVPTLWPCRRRFALNMNSSPGPPFCVWLMLMNLPPESISVTRIVRPWLVPPARASETPPIAAAIRPAMHAVSTRRPTVVLNILMELSHLITCETRRAGSLHRSADLSRGGRWARPSAGGPAAVTCPDALVQCVAVGVDQVVDQGADRLG